MPRSGSSLPRRRLVRSRRNLHAHPPLQPRSHSGKEDGYAKKGALFPTAHFNYQTLADICDILSTAGKLGQAARAVVTYLTNQLQIKGAALMLLNRRSKKLEIAASQGSATTI